MHLAAHLAALIAVMGTGVVYGTDAFCALVQRPALARVDDATLTAPPRRLQKAEQVRDALTAKIKTIPDILRPTLTVATGDLREHQRTAAPVLPQRHRPHHPQRR
jgi:hypothetical protein